ncbi:MAG: alpha/beta hydrolase, partial [Mesorhizobium sp.]
MIDRRNLILTSLAAMLPLEAWAAPRQSAPETFDYGPARLDLYA